MSGYATGIVAILCINLIFAYGIYVTAAAGQLNLGGAGFQAIGAYGAAWLSSVAGQPVWVTIPAAMLISALVGFLVSFPVLRTRGVYMVLATFAFAEVVAGFLLRSKVFGGAIGMVVPDYVGVSVLDHVCGVATLLCSTSWRRAWLAMRSIHDDEAVSTIMGVNVRAVQVAAFTLGGALAGLSGALYAHHFAFVEAQYFNSLLSIYVLALRAHRRDADRVGPAGRQPVLHAHPGIPARRRVVALCRVRRRIVLMMVVRPEGIVTRALANRLSPRNWWPGRRAAPGGSHA